MWSTFDDELASLLPELREVRHDIHRHPELGFEEQRTQQVCRDWLQASGYEPRSSAGTGLVADTNPALPTRLALRADLDALPIHERTDLPYRSVHDGVSHKCGHDGHTTILLGVARVLASRRESLAGNVRLLFQPAEEGVDGGGAKVMVAEGVLDGVPEVYGLHNWPGFPKGCLRVGAGPTMAQVDNIELELVGVGGHGGQPQRCVDPIVAGAHVVTALQTVVSRGLSPLESGVVSVGAFRGGKANNVIPERVRIRGTIRAFDPAVRDRIHARIRQVVESTAAAFGVTARLEIIPEYPVLVNDASCVEHVRAVAAEVVGQDRVSDEALPLTAAEDFSFFANEVSAAYFFLGAGVGPEGQTPGCHHPDFDFDDDLLETGVRMFAGLVRRRVG